MTIGLRGGVFLCLGLLAASTNAQMASTSTAKTSDVYGIERVRELEAASSTITVHDRWPSGVNFEEWAIQGLGNLPGGGYHGMRTEVASPLGPRGVYMIAARVDLFRAPTSFNGWSQEFSGALSRELYHVTVQGRLGTAPPDAKYPATVNGAKVPDQIRPSYHLAGGEVRFTLYGWDLGPERPELASTIWESSGTAPSPDSFDRTWVTRFKMTYTNTDFHIQQPQRLFVLVQNSWQFDARETWRDRTSLALQLGLNDYNKQVSHNAPRIFLGNLDYYGAPGAILGWPNHYGSFQIWQSLTPRLRADSGFTRLNLYNNALVLMWNFGLEWRPDRNWKIAPGFAYDFRRHSGARRSLLLNLSYSW